MKNLPLTKLFKILLLALLLFSIFSITAGEMLFDTLPNILQDYKTQVDNEYNSSDFSIIDVIFMPVAIFSIFAIIGVWKFKNWARHSYLIITIAFLPFYYIFGPVVMNHLEAMFNDLSFMLNGILIYMMYMTPLSNEFKLKANKNEKV